MSRRGSGSITLHTGSCPDQPGLADGIPDPTRHAGGRPANQRPDDGELRVRVDDA